MRKIRMTQIFAAGVLFPALTGLPQPATGNSIDVRRDMEIGSFQGVAGQARLAEVLLSLSPAEKRTIAGIRLPISMLPLRHVAVHLARNGDEDSKADSHPDANSPKVGNTSKPTIKPPKIPPPRVK